MVPNFRYGSENFLSRQIDKFPGPCVWKAPIHKHKTWNQRKFYKTGNLQIVKSLSNSLGLSDKKNTFVEPISN